MTSQNIDLMLTFPIKGTNTTGLPGLAIQTNSGSAPDYPNEFYRLYPIDTANTDEIQLILNAQALTVQRGHMLTLSPGETVQFTDDTQVRSLSFHHNFFCIRVKREEVYCDGIVFNRLNQIPIVAFPDHEQTLLNAQFDELHHILQAHGIFNQERAISTLRTLLLHGQNR